MKAEQAFANAIRRQMIVRFERMLLDHEYGERRLALNAEKDIEREKHLYAEHAIAKVRNSLIYEKWKYPDNHGDER